jgi:hypothetical protein
MEDVNSLSRKNCEKSAAESRRPEAFAPARVRSRKIPSGRSGAFERSSTITNATIRAPEATSSPIVSVVPQPCCVARVSA